MWVAPWPILRLAAKKNIRKGRQSFKIYKQVCGILIRKSADQYILAALLGKQFSCFRRIALTIRTTWITFCRRFFFFPDGWTGWWNSCKTWRNYPNNADQLRWYDLLNQNLSQKLKLNQYSNIPSHVWAQTTFLIDEVRHVEYLIKIE
jgi:hypothetical protein